jgi:hypothetical protein
VLSAHHIITSGEVGSGWGIAQAVTVPVGRVAHTTRGAVLCTSVGQTVEPFRARGTLYRPGQEGRSLDDVRIGAEYLHPGSAAWISLASAIAHNMGVGDATRGSWVVALLLMLTLVGAATRLALRELR